MTAIRARVVLPAVVAVLGVIMPAAAQTNDPALRRVEVAAGGGYAGGADAARRDANLRGPDGGDFRLFSAESQFSGAPLLEVRAGFAWTRRYAVEARLGVSRPDLRSSISADVEGAPPLTLEERVDQYVIDGALLVLLDRFRVGGVIPFVSAGAGYLRQLHEGGTLVEQGTAYHVGGGVRHRLFQRARGLVRSGGVRGDARLYLLSGGAGVDEGLTRYVAGTASFVVGF